jgi:hypothetical protein
MLSSRSDEFGLVHERRDKTGGTREGSRSEVPGFQSFEPRTSNFGSRLSRISRASRVACLVHLVCLVYLVCFVYLVDLVHLVSFVQPKNETSQINQINETNEINKIDQTDQTDQVTVFLRRRFFSASC